MSTELEEGFAEWRGGIEARVSTLEATVKQEAWARAKMDKDMSDLKIQFGKQDFMLKALSKTQSEHTATLREHGEMLRDLRRDVTEVRRDVAGLRRDVTEVRRDVTEVHQDVSELRRGLTEVRRDVTEVRAGIRTIIDLIDKRSDGEASGQDAGGRGQGHD